MFDCLQKLISKIEDAEEGFGWESEALLYRRGLGKCCRHLGTHVLCRSELEAKPLDPSERPHGIIFDVKHCWQKAKVEMTLASAHLFNLCTYDEQVTRCTLDTCVLHEKKPKRWEFKALRVKSFIIFI